MRTFPPFLRTCLVALLVVAGVRSMQAQWITQFVALKGGWNAVYLHVDASYDTVEHLVGEDAASPILEIWQWSPAPTTQQFVQSPQEPVDGGSQWLSWIRNDPNSSTLERLRGNTACLVRVEAATTAYGWQVKGRPVLYAHEWTTTGLNFVGFPTDPLTPPVFERFLEAVPAFLEKAEIYRYLGGELGAGNPARVYGLRTTPVTRGQAFWIRAGNLYNRYYGPFEIYQANETGVDFGDHLNTSAFRLRNLTPDPLTVTVTLQPSEPPPSGQPGISGTPSLLVRGALNTTDLTYGYRELAGGGTHEWELAATGEEGSEVEVVLGLNRPAMGGSPGDLFAGVLQFTDSLGHARVDLAVTAHPASAAGLWIGSAVVKQVGQYLKIYQRDSSNDPVMNDDGSYVVQSVNTELEGVPSPFPLRLIVHNPSVGQAVLMQRVYVGLDEFGNPVVSNSESVLDPDALADARRISAVHLPWSVDNPGWALDGLLDGSAPRVTTVILDYADQASNPFLHTYHPDHDNLDAGFDQELARGSESYTVERQITLTPGAPPDDFNSLTSAGHSVIGDYAETIRVIGLQRSAGPDTRTFEVRGTYVLRRISDLDTLTTP
ncbi:MAG: hypothetical protein KDM81_01495 [Verrucomicrobiae bacterium]|nr:hypothetical protein [Verrucomicrobiae bacterium]